jgi:hypothetical protein
MAKPLAICLEDLEPHGGAPRYLRCVAVVGREPGLRVDGAGSVLWKSDEAAACELWVSLDDKLILYRREGGAAVLVRRDGRELDVPAGKPVVLLNQDRFEVGGRRLRVHVHGSTDHVLAPSPLPEPAGSGRARAAAAVAALGAVLGAADCKKDQAAGGDVEVRTAPPAVAHPADAGTPPPDASGLPPQEVLDASAQGPDGEPIEVRVTPPAVAPPPDFDVTPPPPPPPPPEADATPPAPDAAATTVEPIEVRERPPAAVRLDEPPPPVEPSNR